MILGRLNFGHGDNFVSENLVNIFRVFENLVSVFAGLRKWPDMITPIIKLNELPPGCSE